ncbi:hypothetical protein [Nostoc sp.]|uniref:hypothetical protein n=1 Tax=Nostoc sp. TaxID=1180 RepID=UPI002FFCBE58
MPIVITLSPELEALLRDKADVCDSSYFILELQGGGSFMLSPLRNVWDLPT